MVLHMLLLFSPRRYGVRKVEMIGIAIRTHDGKLWEDEHQETRNDMTFTPGLHSSLFPRTRAILPPCTSQPRMLSRLRERSPDPQ